MAVATCVLLADQLAKVAAVKYLAQSEPVELFGGLISLRFLRNPGAALGAGSSKTVFLTVVAIVVSVVVLVIARRLGDSAWAVGLGLLLGGAVGNLVDRLFRQPGAFKGHVVDYIDYGPFVGNFADIALTFAAIVIVWRSWSGVSLDGTRHEPGQTNQTDQNRRDS